MPLNLTQAAQFVRITLSHLGREYPGLLRHVMNGPLDWAEPRALHPAFYGSYDWHSCVHGWWQVMRLARLFPHTVWADETVARADVTLTAEHIAGEVSYFQRPGSAAFERPYGWAWLLALHQELALRADRPWARAVEPLARLISDRFQSYLARLTYPIRSGSHANTAFALILAEAWAACHDPALQALVVTQAQRWFARDQAVPVREPDGDDFLSPTLCEAVLMSRILDAEAFSRWFAHFLPDPLGPRTTILRKPVVVSDRTDGKIAHLDGLNLSRAWCWRRLAQVMPQHHPLVDAVDGIMQAHLSASLPHLADDYMGAHWLATFALLALNDLPDR